MRAPRFTTEQIEQIRAEYAEPGVSWKALSAKHGVSAARLYQVLDPERYWRSVRRRADRELKRLREAA